MASHGARTETAFEKRKRQYHTAYQLVTETLAHSHGGPEDARQIAELYRDFLEEALGEDEAQPVRPDLRLVP